MLTVAHIVSIINSIIIIVWTHNQFIVLIVTFLNVLTYSVANERMTYKIKFVSQKLCIEVNSEHDGSNTSSSEMVTSTIEFSQLDWAIVYRGIQLYVTCHNAKLQNVHKLDLKHLIPYQMWHLCTFNSHVVSIG